MYIECCCARFLGCQSFNPDKQVQTRDCYFLAKTIAKNLGGKKASALLRRDSYWENITVSMKKSGTEGKKTLVRNFEGGFQKTV